MPCSIVGKFGTIFNMTIMPKTTAFNITVGIASSMQLPDFDVNESKVLKDVILVPNDSQLAEYISYNDQTNMINYTPKATEESQIEQFEGKNLFKIKLIDSEGEEYVYDLTVQINVCSFSVPIQLTGPFVYKYYTDEVPTVKAEFENEKSNPVLNSLSYITYEPA